MKTEWLGNGSGGAWRRVGKVGRVATLAAGLWVGMAGAGVLGAESGPGVIQFRSGGEYAYDAAWVEGDVLVLRVGKGRVRLGKDALGEESRRRFFPAATETNLTGGAGDGAALPTAPVPPGLPTAGNAGAGDVADGRAGGQGPGQGQGEGAGGGGGVGQTAGAGVASAPVAAGKGPDGMTEEELIEELGARFTGGAGIDLQADFPHVSADVKVEEGSFRLKTKLESNPEVEVVYRMPVRKDGSAGPNAHNLIFYCPHPQEAKPKAKGEGKLLQGRFWKYFSDTIGLGIFSMYMDTPGGDERLAGETYWKGDPRWTEAVLEAQAELTARFKLKPRKLVIFGFSIGSTMGQRIGLERPDMVDAVAMQGASDLGTVAGRSDVVWFVNTTRGDSVNAENDAFVEALRAAGSHVIRAVTPPRHEFRGMSIYYHCGNETSEGLLQAFLTGVIKQREQTGRVQPERWPLGVDRRKPFRVLTNPSAQLDAAPESERMMMPCPAFAYFWGMIPSGIRTLNLPGAAGSAGTACLMACPAPGKPKGVVLYNQRYDYLSIGQIIDNIAYLAERGYVALAPKLRGNPRERIEDAIACVARHSQLKNLPLYLVGLEEHANALWDAAKGRTNLAAKAVATIGFDPKDSLEESVLRPLDRVMCPVLFVYDEAGMKAEAITKGKIREFMDRCGKRDQPAELGIVAETDREKEQRKKDEETEPMRARGRLWHKAIVMVEDFFGRVAAGKAGEDAPEEKDGKGQKGKPRKA